MHNDQHSHPFQREDHRRDFERIVDDALHLDDIVRALSASTGVNAEQLRTATLAHADTIAARTPDEYQRLVDAEEHATPARSGEVSPTFTASTVSVENAEGVGMFALATWVTLIVAAISAAVFLGTYYLIALPTHHDESVAPVRLAGFASVAIALGAAALAGLAMLLHAGGNRGTPEPTKEVREARDEWHTALLHQGVLPFMTTKLAAATGIAETRVIPLDGTASEYRGHRAAERRAGVRQR